jgi:TrmH family RNA methyltransferase
MAGFQESERPPVIRSADNQTIKLVRSLRQRKTREAERLFVVEGLRLVSEALAAGIRPRIVLFREDRAKTASEISLPGGRSFKHHLVEGRLFDSIAETTTPQGVLAVFSIPKPSIPPTESPLVVIVDRLSDPGNLGTLIRVSAAASATAVVLIEGTVDPYNAKVVRSAMGAHFNLPLFWLDEGILDWITLICPNRVISDAQGDLEYDQVDWTGPSAIIVGPETGGFSDEALALATSSARIPMSSEVESLNASIAGAVMLFEANRQRRAAHEA